MKLTAVTILALLLGAVVSLHAQQRPAVLDAKAIDSLLAIGDTIITPPTHMIVLNPGGIAADYITLSYYQAINGWNGVGVLAGYTYRQIAEATVTGEFGGVSWRYHPGARALWRFHIEPMVFYHRYHLADSNRSASGIAAGGMLGWQWFPAGGVGAGFAIGAEYVIGDRDAAGPVLDRMFGIRPLVAFNIGYAW